MAAELNLKRKHWKRSSRRLHEMLSTRETMWTGQKRNVSKQCINWRERNRLFVYIPSLAHLHCCAWVSLFCCQFYSLTAGHVNLMESLRVIFVCSRISGELTCDSPGPDGEPYTLIRFCCVSRFFVRSLLWSVAAGWIMVFRLELSRFFHSLLLVYF